MRSSGIRTIPLVRIAKDWNWPNLLRQTPGEKGVWDGFQFTTDDVERCDALVVLNNRMNREVRVSCPKNRVWAVMQEPYARGYTDWMVEGHESFARILTHYPADSSRKYIVSHPAVPWHVNRTFDQLISMQIPGKPRPLSWVVGNCRDLPGHWDRLDFLRTHSYPSISESLERHWQPFEKSWPEVHWSGIGVSLRLLKHGVGYCTSTSFFPILQRCSSTKASAIIDTLSCMFHLTEEG